MFQSSTNDISMNFIAWLNKCPNLCDCSNSRFMCGIIIFVRTFCVYSFFFLSMLLKHSNNSSVSILIYILLFKVVAHFFCIFIFQFFFSHYFLITFLYINKSG